MALGDDPNHGGTASPAPGPVAAGDRAERELNQKLVGFVLEFARGVEEFRRAYGIANEERSWPDAEEYTRRLVGRGGVGEARETAEARRELDLILADLKVHQIAVLEGYTEATHAGSTRLLESVDPEKVRDQFDRGTVQVGPFRMSARSRPVLIQAIWEEILRRCQQYRALDPAQFERFYRDGFQQGYRRFWQARRARGSSDATS